MTTSTKPRNVLLNTAAPVSCGVADCLHDNHRGGLCRSHADEFQYFGETREDPNTPYFIDGEEWLPVPGLTQEIEGLLDISTLGRVYFRPHLHADRWVEGRLLPQHPTTKYGGMQIHFTRSNLRYSYLVSNLVMATFVGPKPEGMIVVHGDGGPEDDSLENLRYGTLADARESLKRWREQTGQVTARETPKPQRKTTTVHEKPKAEKPKADSLGPDIAAELTYLDVPFIRKEAAKKNGAKWNRAAKLWYVEAGTDLGPFAEWRFSEKRHAEIVKQRLRESGGPVTVRKIGESAPAAEVKPAETAVSPETPDKRVWVPLTETVEWLRGVLDSAPELQPGMRGLPTRKINEMGKANGHTTDRITRARRALRNKGYELTAFRGPEGLWYWGIDDTSDDVSETSAPVRDAAEEALLEQESVTPMMRFDPLSDEGWVSVG